MSETGNSVTARRHDVGMSHHDLSAEPATAADFAAAARTLTREARARGLIGPSFRCPPRLVGVDRTLRRRGEGAVVSVRLRGRPWIAVLGDMIEGVVVANRLSPPRSDRLRNELWQACAQTTDHPTTRVA